jgi:hypothetical protein
MALLAFELLFRLLWGSALGLVFVRRTESSEKFVKIAARISWGLGLCAACLLWISEGASGSAALALGLFVVGFQLYTSLILPWTRLLGVVCVLLSPFVWLGGESWYYILNFVFSGLLLGGFFVGQFLGHWFLNVPGMHIRELKRVMSFLFVGIALKSIEILVFMIWKTTQLNPAIGLDAMGRPLAQDISNTDFLLKLNPSNSLFALEGDLFLGLGTYGVILLSMRLLWGILAPWVLALMVNQTVKTRSTQSATGILYAACVMVLVGEATALYLRNVLKFFM